MPKGYPNTKSCPNCGDGIFQEEAAYCSTCGEPLFKTRKRLKDTTEKLEYGHFRIHLARYSPLLVCLSIHTPEDDMTATIVPYKKLRTFIDSYEETVPKEG